MSIRVLLPLLLEISATQLKNQVQDDALKSLADTIPDVLQHLRSLTSLTYLKAFIEKSKTELESSLRNRSQKFAQSDLYKITGFNDPGEYLFRAVTFFETKGTHQLRKKNTPLSYTSVRSYVPEYVKSIGLDEKSFGTHSLRRGGATSAANNGAKDRLFQKHGRRKSVSAKDGYVDEDLLSILSVSRSLGL